MKIYHNPRCSKSRETLQIIENAGKEVQIVEYLKEEINREELSDVLAMLDMNPSEIIRKSEPIYKELFKGKKLSEEEWLEAMLKYPKLIERPIVVKDGKAVLGRPPEIVKTLF